MKCRQVFSEWFGSALIGAVALATTPLLFGGGGDEGVDILPNLYGGGGGSGAGGPDGPLGSGSQVPHGVTAGYIAVHGKNAGLDANWTWAGTGLRLLGHDRSDLFLGTPGQEPNSHGETALDITTKGSRKLKYGEYRPLPGSLNGSEFLTLNGRFVIEDLFDDQTLEISSRDRTIAYLEVIVGKRGTTCGAIEPSFTRIDSILTGTEPSGRIDLDAVRDEMQALYGGTGVDIAVSLSLPVARGTEAVWATFNVDDSRERWDIEVRIP